jgi:hypothetical protein
LFFTRHKDTKKSIHFQIIAAVSLFTDAVLPFSGGVSLINDDDLEMDADKNKFSSRNDGVSIVKRE